MRQVLQKRGWRADALPGIGAEFAASYFGS